MSNTLSFTELCGQHVELLPARTVLSMFVTADDPSAGGGGVSSSGDPVSQVVASVMSGLAPKLP
jgi:hypothetical protein